MILLSSRNDSKDVGVISQHPIICQRLKTNMLMNSDPRNRFLIRLLRFFFFANELSLLCFKLRSLIYMDSKVINKRYGKTSLIKGRAVTPLLLVSRRTHRNKSSFQRNHLLLIFVCEINYSHLYTKDTRADT